MAIDGFSVARLPRIVFGAGTLARVPGLVAELGRNCLLVTGERSFVGSDAWTPFADAMAAHEVGIELVHVTDEPSPQFVDDVVRAWHGSEIDVVLAIGGGSALDAAKAIAGLLPHGNSVLDHLEGVGRGLPYEGPATPFIAVPTTAGTGSEATRNAVLGVRGPDGYKKSFRHDELVPRVAVVDPELLATCTPAQIAANGMDALTQLVESFVSTRASALTDALALSGIQSIRQGLMDAWHGGPGEEAADGRSNMAYGALLSGITLAQAGLGAVHGLASPLGAFFPIPHGVACGTLLGVTTEVNIDAMLDRDPDNVALDKYAELAEHLCDEQPADDEEAWDLLIQNLHDLVEQLSIPPLGDFGVTDQDVDHIVAHSRGNSMQTNPVTLTDEEIAGIVAARL